jgi:hypothetical protein
MAFFSKCTFKLERTSKQIHSGSVIIILLKYPDVDKSRELYVNDDVHLSKKSHANLGKIQNHTIE